MKIKDGILFGKAFDPTNSNQEWSDFLVNLLTKEIKGGTWREFLIEVKILKLVRRRKTGGNFGNENGQNNTSRQPLYAI